MKQHKQLVEDRIVILEEIISRLSGGLTQALAQQMAATHVDRLTESRNRLHELKQYYAQLYT